MPVNESFKLLTNILYDLKYNILGRAWARQVWRIRHVGLSYLLSYL